MKVCCIDERDGEGHVSRSVKEQDREYQVPIGLDRGVRVDDAALALVLYELRVPDLILVQLMLIVLFNHD